MSRHNGVDSALHKIKKYVCISLGRNEVLRLFRWSDDDELADI